MGRMGERAATQPAAEPDATDYCVECGEPILGFGHGIAINNVGYACSEHCEIRARRKDAGLPLYTPDPRD